MPTLYLVDGYALIYRAFFAMIARPLTTRRGENTSAAWGVTNFLLRLLERRRPDYLAWVHDVGESFRHQTYPQYKATREKLTAELQQEFDRSVERIEQLLEAFRVPLIGVEGYEADDVIGTLAHAARGLQVVIVSGDKDFYQLIGPGIALLNPGRGGPAAVEEHWVDQTNASERLGVPPERVVDYLALVGDSSDNVPGVKGVGEKTALELLKTFGDLDAILANAERISGKRAREAVQQHADLARLSRELVTIKRDVPLPLDLERLRVRPPDVARLTELFTELEFRSLIPKLASLEPAATASAVAVTPRDPVATGAPSLATLTPARAEPNILDDPAQLPAAVAEWRRAPLLALDTETSSLDPMRAELVGMSLAVRRGGRGTSPSRTRLPTASSPAGPRRGISRRSRARRWRRCGSCSPIRACRRRDTTSSTTGWSCAGQEWSSRACRSTRCSRASCSIPGDARTPSRSWRASGCPSRWGRTPSSWAGEGRSVRSPRCPWRTRRATVRRTVRSCCVSMTRSGRSSKTTSWCACSRRSRCHSCPCSWTWNRGGCAST